ncbi:MAG: hypothetical protein J6K22_01470 [Spirochaetaceae bacterium]|nr:hypothetical protein [Spirochaetaceae bacterium]
MKKKYFATLLLFFAFSFPIFSQTQNTKQIFSLDTGYLAKGLKNNGWGIGFTYEREIFRGFSVKGGLSHMTMWMKNTFEYGIKVKFSLGKIIKFFKDWSTIKQ